MPWKVIKSIRLTLYLSIFLFTFLQNTAALNDSTNNKYYSWNTLNHLKSNTLPNIQKTAVEKLITRILNENATLFKVVVDPNFTFQGRDKFQLKKIDSKKIQITGNTGVAVAWGLHYYLKNYCNCHISWNGYQLKLPNILPDVNEVVTSNDRYYQNVCTAGYSSAWWQWKEWEKNIDWMALNGINLALAFHAQEAIWEKVYMKFNLTEYEIKLHFGGPAFLPWTRMGNIRGWGGPLSNSWHNHTVQLQHLILNRMRELGIIPVLPAFAGHVPRDFIRVFPNARVTTVKQWNNFEDQYCCPYILDPTDPLFRTLGEEFLQMYINEFGTNNIYNCDSFNENDPHRGDLDYLGATAKAIFKVMSNVDPKAIWLMQGWLFVHSAHFWSTERVKAFITSVPIGKMIILDLQSEQFPQYDKFNSYFGQPFIWCMLHNFGGTLGMFGSAGIINERVFAARKMSNSTMIGIGLTPEGINQNYVIYEFMNEMGYRQKPVDIDSWFSNYSIKRYGFADDYIKMAWQELGHTIYNYNDTLNIRGHYVITKRPSLDIRPWYWYDLKSFLKIWGNFIKPENLTSKSNDLFKYDIVDISRQALQTTADFIYYDIFKAYRFKSVAKLQAAAAQLLELFDDLEEILASCKGFLLGVWLEDAKAAAPTDDRPTRENYEFNARNQITLWGPNGEIVDYANKQWSGVVRDYFRARWALFLKELEKSLENETEFNKRRVREIIYNKVELPFSYSQKLYPTEPKGDSIQIAIKLYNKWLELWEKNI